MNIEIGVGIGSGLFAVTSSDRLIAYAWATAGNHSVSTLSIVHKTVNAVPGNSSASGLAPIVSNEKNVNVLSVIVNANGNALIPSVAIAGSISINVVIASSNLDSIIPVVSTIRNVSVGGVVANSTASTGVPTVTVGGSSATYYLQMDGVDDYADGGAAQSLNIGQNFNIKVVVKFPSGMPNRWNTILSKESWTAGHGYLLMYNKSTNALIFAKAGVEYLTKIWSPTLETWYTIEAISNGTTTSLLVDGVVVVTAATPTIVDSAVPFYIGSRHGNTGTGQIDRGMVDIREVEITKSGVVSVRYDFSTGTAQDQSGNGNHATLNGGTWVVA